MAFRNHPPPVFVGGAQPYAPRRLPPSETAVAVDEPPRRSQALLIAATLAAWQAAPAPPQLPRYVPQAAAAEQPAFTRPWLAEVLTSWQPEGAVQRPVRLAPSLLAVPEDPPVPTDRKWLPTIIQAWQPGPPTPPIAVRNLPVSVTAVPEDLPSPRDQRSWLSSVLSSWQPGPPAPPITIRYVPQAGPAVEEQPAFARTWLSNVVIAWEPPLPAPQLPRHLPISVTAVPEDQPPPTGGARLAARIAASWIGPDFLPQQQRRFVQAAEAQAPFSRLWIHSILTAWAGDGVAQPQRKLAPSLLAVAVDDPPFGQRSWNAAVLRSWVIEPDVAPAQRKVRSEEAVALITGLQAVFSSFEISPTISGDVAITSTLSGEAAAGATLSGNANLVA